MTHQRILILAISTILFFGLGYSECNVTNCDRCKDGDPNFCDVCLPKFRPSPYTQGQCLECNTKNCDVCVHTKEQDYDYMDVCTTCSSGFSLWKDKCWKNCKSFDDCNFNASSSDINSLICNKDIGEGACTPCQKDSQCESSFPGFNYVCGGEHNQYDWYNVCGECRNSYKQDICPQHTTCIKNNSNLYQCVDCATNQDCEWRTDGLLICDTKNYKCTNKCNVDYGTFCSEGSARANCSCSTRYYPRSSIFGDGYRVEGICRKTWSGYSCRNDSWDATREYRAEGESCYHKNTLVNIRGSDGNIVKKRISDLQTGDKVQVHDPSSDSLLFDSVLIKLEHSNSKALVDVFELYLSDQNGKEITSLTLTPNHYLYIYRNNILFHLPTINVTIGDLLLYLNPQTNEFEYVKLTQVTLHRDIPQSDLYQVYTSSNTIIANDLYASCKSEGDGSQYFTRVLGAINKYIHKDASQKIIEWSQTLGVIQLYKQFRKWATIL